MRLTLTYLFRHGQLRRFRPLLLQPSSSSSSCICRFPSPLSISAAAMANSDTLSPTPNHLPPSSSQEEEEEEQNKEKKKTAVKAMQKVYDDGEPLPFRRGPPSVTLTPPRLPFAGAAESTARGLDALTEWWINCAKGRGRKFKGLTGMLKHLDLWVIAYQRACNDWLGASDAKSAFVGERVLPHLFRLQEAVLRKEFSWGGLGKIYLLSPLEDDSVGDGEEMNRTQWKRFCERIHSAPIFQDRVVQEVLLMILEPLYEVRFSPKSHAFRPGRNAHTVLRSIRRSFSAYIWYIHGDLRELSTGVKPGLIVDVMSRSIKDWKVLDLIRAAINTYPPPSTPTTTDSKKPKSAVKRQLTQRGPKPYPYWLQLFFGFTPAELSDVPDWGCCGVLTPLLLNIYLDQLDRWMDAKAASFFKPSLSDVVVIGDGGPRVDLQTHFVPATPREKTLKMDYVRFGTQFLIGVRGAHANAYELRTELLAFIEKRFLFKREADSIPITHVSKGIPFLDHVLSRKVVHPKSKDFGGVPDGSIVKKKSVGTVLTLNVCIDKCMVHFRDLGLLKGSDDAQPIFRLFHAPQEFTNAQINCLLETLSDWFQYADNRKSATMYCHYILKSSIAKMYAAKYKLRSRARVYKAGGGDLSLPIEGQQRASEHYKKMLKEGLIDVSIEGLKYSKVRWAPGTEWTPLPQYWVPEHEKLITEMVLMQTPAIVKEQLRLLDAPELSSPQELMSALAWKFQKFLPLNGAKAIETGSSLSIEEDKFIPYEFHDGNEASDHNLYTQDSVDNSDCDKEDVKRFQKFRPMNGTNEAIETESLLSIEEDKCKHDEFYEGNEFSDHNLGTQDLSANSNSDKEDVK